MTFLFWLDWTLFALAALSTAYIFFFSLAASLYNRCHRATPPAAVEARQRFLFLIPAYGEDAVIQQTADKALAVDYPSHLMHVAVISDHMSDATNQALALKPLTLFIATYDNSTKAKALQMAMHGTTFESDYVVILDADNHVDADFLTRLSSHLALMRNPVAVQCHRTAKNTNTSTAILDAVSEEVNNHIFRLGHKAVGLSSALIGSGMCLQTEWFAHHVGLIQTAGEDKELERLLLAEGHRIHYLPDINVYDEKVQNQANFSRQRRRWLSAQFYSALDMASHLTWNINYLDKFIQQLLIPRSMLLALVTLMSLLTLGERWLALALVLFTTLLIAIPRRLLNRRLLRALVHIPGHTLSFAMNIFKIKGQKDKFHHTEHVE